MYKNILVPVVLDHGAQSAEALKVAQALLTEGGKITLLHVIEEIPSYASTYLPEGIGERRRQESLDALLDMAKTAEAPCEALVVPGHSSSTILEFGRTHGADCIVIASHKPGIEDYFLGSTAARVVRHAKCAVHVLR